MGLFSDVGKWVNKFSGYGSFKKAYSSVFGPATKPSEDELQQFWALINHKQGKHLFHNGITYMNDRRQHRERWVDALINSDIPLALINGSVDPVSGKHMVERYQQLACRLDYLKELPTIGHYPHWEAPEAVAAAYLQFGQKLQSG